MKKPGNDPADECGNEKCARCYTDDTATTGFVDPWHSEGLVLVYCTVCTKTHAVKPGEKPCEDGVWLDPTPVSP